MRGEVTERAVRLGSRLLFTVTPRHYLATNIGQVVTDTNMFFCQVTHHHRQSVRSWLGFIVMNVASTRVAKWLWTLSPKCIWHVSKLLAVIQDGCSLIDSKHFTESIFEDMILVIVRSCSAAD